MAGKTLLSTVVALCFLLWGHVKVAADKQLANADDSDSGFMRRILTTTTSDVICQTEDAACADDTSCVTCYSVFVDAAEECDTDDDADCSEAQQAFCCTLEDEDENCEGDAKFNDFIECLWQNAVDTGEVECEHSDVDLSACIGVTGRYFSWSVLMGLCSTAATGVVVAATGFVV
ncbi:unnamed protein product [Scytosiphon promiscuus]